MWLESTTTSDDCLNLSKSTELKVKIQPYRLKENTKSKSEVSNTMAVSYS